MKKYLLLTTVMGIAWLGCTGGTATAASIGMNFLGDDDPNGLFILTPDMEAGVVPQKNWNNIPSYLTPPNSGLLQSLSDETGENTVVTLYYQANDAWHSDGPTETPNDKLMKGILKTSAPGYADPAPDIPAGTMHLTLSNLPAGNYDVYLYVAENGAGAEGDFTVGTKTYYLTEISSFDGTFVAATSTDKNNRDTDANYILWKDVPADASGKILIVAFKNDRSNDGLGVAGIQLVKKAAGPFPPNTAGPSVTQQPTDAAALVGGTVTFTLQVNGPWSVQWRKNGTPIGSPSLAVGGASRITTPALTLADNDAKYDAVITNKNGTVTSSTAVVHVAALTQDFAPGVVKFEAYTGINGTAVDTLTTNDKFIAGTPDDVRLLAAIDSPSGYAENYGAKVSGFIIPPESGSYRFFLRSDDASQLWLSPDDKEANAVMIAEEAGCCDPFKEPDNAETSEPQDLTAGKKYAFYALLKEGGGGDYVQVAARKEGDTTAAGTLKPLSGLWIGANAKPTLGDPQIITQPQSLPQLQEGRTGRLTVDAAVTPAGFNFPALIQWQKNGTDIPGANSKTYVIANATSANSGTYHAVVSAPSGKTVTSADATVTVVPDTFAPVPTAGALLKNGKQEIGIGFDEEVKATGLSDKANYSLSAGTIDSVRVVNRPKTGFDASLNVPEYNGVVLVASGLTAGQAYQVTVKNIEDLKGNKIPAAGATASFKAEDKKTWSVVGANENGFPNDVVRLDEGSFDVMSSGVGFWADYDEATFVNEKVKGNFDAKVQLVEQDPSSQWARTGLMAREALDEGKVRPDRGDCASAIVDGEYCVPKEKLFSRLQTVHANAAIRADAGVSQNGYENHWRTDVNLSGGVNGSYAAPWANQMESADTGFGPLDYPNVWMRLQRDGNFLITYRSTDGQAWNQMTRREFTNLVEEIYIGPFYSPEMNNNADPDNFPGGIDDLLKHSVVAKFRNYTITTAGGPVDGGGSKFTGIRVSGTDVIFEWTGTGILQVADAVTGPWTDVANATSPRTVPTAGTTAKYYRFKP